VSFTGKAVDNQTRGGSALFLFFGDVELAGFEVNGKAMNALLDRCISDLLVLSRCKSLKCTNGAAVTGDEDTAAAGAGFHDIASGWKRKSLSHGVFVEIEDGEEIVFFADEEGAMLLRGQSHAVISAATGNGVLCKTLALKSPVRPRKVRTSGYSLGTSWAGRGVAVSSRTNEVRIKALRANLMGRLLGLQRNLPDSRKKATPGRAGQV
jgi:hypothetical protein